MARQECLGEWSVIRLEGFMNVWHVVTGSERRALTRSRHNSKKGTASTTSGTLLSLGSDRYSFCKMTNLDRPCALFVPLSLIHI